MIKRLISIEIICLLITAGFLGFFTIELEVAGAAGITIYVDDDNVMGPWDGSLGNPYKTIQDGVNASGDGDTVFVFNGTYNEHVVVDKAINLTGEDRDITIIDGGGSGDVVNVSANGVNISGFTVTGGGPISDYGAGIDLHDVQYCSVFENNVSNNIFKGIYLYESLGNEITNNKVSNNQIGIELLYSSDNRIINNTVSWNSHKGVRIWISNPTGKTSNNNIISNNNVSNNPDCGIELDSSDDNTIIGNNVSNNNYGIVLYDCNGNSIAGNFVLKNELSIGLTSSSNNDIIENDVINNNPPPGSYKAGISLRGSPDNRIINNNILSNNGSGIYLDDSAIGSSDNNTISDNIMSSNTGHGIYLRSPSNHNVITNNKVSNNAEDGIYVYDNEASYNNIIGNTVSSNENQGITIFGCSDNNVTANTVFSNKRDGIYLYSAQRINMINNKVWNNSKGISLASSADNLVTANDLSDNHQGLFLSNSWTNNITANDIFSNNDDGIHLDSSSGNNLKNNNVYLNTGNGIYLALSSDSNISGNHISDNQVGINVTLSSNSNNITINSVSNNDHGIYLEGSLNNSVFHNNIIDNFNQAHDDSSNGNRWDNGYPSGGNYWSDFDEPGEGAYDDYKGPDQDVWESDGIVDTGSAAGGGKNPYVIDLDSQDTYPLIELAKFLFLYEGWNLISVPLIQPDTKLGSVLLPVNGTFDAVQWYDISDVQDHWKLNRTSKPAHLNDLDTIDHRMGFWIHITEPGGVIFYYTGLLPMENQFISLFPGWNLVGFPSLSNKNRTAALNNLTYGNEVDSVWTHNSATKKWEEVGSSDSFQLCRGYWVHVTTECTWEVPL
ncbi:MAG: right-handed parallel beta-helix repeat-containing protein [Thermoplasmata archaeon]|nr:MAG: right-handed parallel beta-helix repeat-containing protein [Thermoplasmata archaeon]